MDTWKNPPRAKVYEALSAVVDGRVELTSDTTALVGSSSGGKKYEVDWTENRTAFASNDNASYWRGYLGYPILAVLLRLGVIPYSREVASHLAGIAWKTINQKYGNRYDLAIAEVLADLEARGVPAEPIMAEVDRIFADVCQLQLAKLPIRNAPPAEG